MKNLITHLNESLRIGINDTPEENLPENLETFFVLDCEKSINRGMFIFRFEEYKVDLCKNNGDNLYYTIAESTINKNIGFSGFKLVYDSELNLFYYCTNSLFMYIIFFPNDERIQRFYPIFSNIISNTSEYTPSTLLNALLGSKDYDILSRNLQYNGLNDEHTCTMNGKEIKTTMRKLGV